nr:hypothetical protein PanWU01x14_301810 [Ipomoea trifida]
MNPVERITPAANALIIKNKFLSGLSAGTADLPSTGKETPMALATRIDAMAPSLYLRAKLLSLSSSSDSQVHSPRTIVGNRVNISKPTEAIITTWFATLVLVFFMVSYVI